MSTLCLRLVTSIEVRFGTTVAADASGGGSGGGAPFPALPGEPLFFLPAAGL